MVNVSRQKEREMEKDREGDGEEVAPLTFSTRQTLNIELKSSTVSHLQYTLSWNIL